MGTDVFPTGTATLFQQTSAPTGWTKSTTYNDYALRIVSGTGGGVAGSVAFSSAFVSQPYSGTVNITSPGASGAQTGTVGGSHGHALNPAGPFMQTYALTQPLAYVGIITASPGPNTMSVSFGPAGYTSLVGGDGSHTHPLSWTASTPVTGGTINLAVQYIDVIICTIN